MHELRIMKGGFWRPLSLLGVVHLQPTHDAVQVFLSKALKLDPVGMSLVLEVKFQSPLWQVCSL